MRGVEAVSKANPGTSYTYELCFFGRATQKSNKDHSSNFLG